MNFKNELEQRCYDIAVDALGGGVSIEHNKTIQIENALFSEVASFKGPPAKEVDVLVAELSNNPKVVLLISCKLFTRKAEPAHVQEWCSVVQTMNKYADGTLFFGVVVSPSGFTNGCEAWATSHNIGILPPPKGRNLKFNIDTVLRMYERLLIALRARVHFPLEDLLMAPSFYDFTFRIVADFEGHQEEASDDRYCLIPQEWESSFQEMYSAIAGRKIEDIYAIKGATVLILSEDFLLIFNEKGISFGKNNKIQLGEKENSKCFKNLDMEDCTLDFIKSIVVGKPVTSAGDFGKYIEFGVDSGTCQ